MTGAEIASIVIAALAFVISGLTFIWSIIFGKLKLFYEIYSQFNANDNARIACMEVKNGNFEYDSQEYKEFEFHLEQFLMFINALLGVVKHSVCKKYCLGLIKYELNVIKESEDAKQLIFEDRNGLNNLQDYIRGKKHGNKTH